MTDPEAYRGGQQIDITNRAEFESSGLDLSAQDARALVSHLTERGKLEHTFGAGRGGYLYVIDGRLSLDGDSLRTGDAAKITGQIDLEMATDVGAELILFDVPLEFEPSACGRRLSLAGG